jgi:isoaspartyl peptidase/L-asparaginase-like protein (Ntn-hydrolase superfamily)
MIDDIIKRVLALIPAWPWAKLVIGILAALLALQSLRIDGLRLPLVGTIVTGFKAHNTALRAENEQLKAASREAASKAVADKARREAINQFITERADNAELQAMRSELDRARSFVRVQQAACDNRSRPAATAEDRGSGFDAGTGAMPAMDGVLVSESDVMICTEAVVKARSWREWGLAISAATAE